MPRKIRNTDRTPPMPAPCLREEHPDGSFWWAVVGMLDTETRTTVSRLRVEPVQALHGNVHVASLPNVWVQLGVHPFDSGLPDWLVVEVLRPCELSPVALEKTIELALTKDAPASV